MTALAAGRADLVARAERLRADAVARHPVLAGASPPALVAIGLASVDWERAARELGAGPWRPLRRDPLLGAMVHLAPGNGEPAVLLLEPDTEGPLAAALARFGEGLAAIYVQPTGPRLAADRAGRSDRVAASGPLGPARLLSGAVWGPHVVALEPRATIEP